jgi:probable rRNA maturation factor
MPSSAPGNISFHFLVPSSLKNRTALKAFISLIFRKEGKKLNTLGYVFCSDDYLLEINKTYLQHDYYTDIITFDLSSGPDSGIEAEIYISLDRVKENARQYGSGLSVELQRVIFHGALHLCGYKDKSASEKKKMRAMEDHYLKQFKQYVPRGTK